MNLTFGFRDPAKWGRISEMVIDDRKCDFVRFALRCNESHRGP